MSDLSPLSAPKRTSAARSRFMGSVLEQLQPVIRVHRRGGLLRLLRRNAERPQEIAMHVALAFHGVAGEEAVKGGFIGGGERDGWPRSAR